ncbi:MAG: adenosylcobinamide-GDP ribazoletransferase [Thermomicrobiales bacterium]
MSATGWGGGATRARALEIMRDSRIGTFGAVGLILLIGLKWSALAALPPALVPAVLIAVPPLSRGAAITLMAALPYARVDDSRARPFVSRPAPARLLAIGVMAVTPLGLLPVSWWPALLVAAGTVGGLCALWFRRHLGGYTGDRLGATQQLAELVILLTAVACA